MTEDLPEWRVVDFPTGPDDPRYKKLRETIERETAVVTAQKDAFRAGTLSVAEIAALFGRWNAVVEAIESLHAWATFRYHRDTDDAAAKSFSERIDREVAGWHAAFVFVTSGIQAWSAAYADAALAAPELAPYRWMIVQARQLASHTLTDGEERVVALKRATSHEAWSRLRLELDNRQKPGTMRVDGTEVDIRLSTQQLVHHADPAVRLEAHQRIKESYAPDIAIYAHAYNQVAGDYETESRDLRSYGDGQERETTESGVPAGAVDAMLGVLEKNEELFRRFYRLKAKMIGLTKQTSADIYAPIGGAMPTRSYAQAWEDVEAALGSFDAEYAAMTRRFRDEPWIDVPIKATKYKGAYCWGAPDHPYLLLNWEPTLRDAFTLAHELGHGVHGLHAAAAPYAVRSTSYVIAETASQLNEDLLLERYRATLKPEEFRTVLAGKIDDVLNALFRQGLIARFEREAHARVRETGLTAAWLNETWLRLVTERNGDALETLPFEQYEWARIPHVFDHPFYVYSYAMSMCVVRALIEKRQEMGERFVPAYRAFLAAGGTRSPQELLADFGLRLDDPGLYTQALTSVERLITELESLA